MERIRILTTLDIIALHDDAMKMSDQEPATLVRRDSLKSAAEQAKHVAWCTNAGVAEITVHLTTHIAMAYSWVDGNKRTAVYAGLLFAGINGSSDPSAADMLTFANFLLRYIEAEHESRDAQFADFVTFVETWFA